MQTELASKGVSDEGIAYFDGFEFDNNLRVTWINADGTVIFDSKSDTSDMENHLEREEIKQAFAQGLGFLLSNSYLFMLILF
jgi:two-component system phosphate regulon sensor histidine kinase PhoR